LAVLFAIASFVSAEHCTVEETRSHFGIQTARFLFQSIQVSLTVPFQFFQSDPVTVFLEAPGAGAPDFPRLLMETGGERVAVADGTALHITPRLHQRIVFNLSTDAGEQLCSWQPWYRVSANSPPQTEDGFRHFFPEQFRYAGAPVHVPIGGKLVHGSGVFRIDGIEAAILARSSREVILRDPNPRVGLRTIESQGYSVTLPFVWIELNLARSLKGRGTLGIKVRGFALVKRRPEDSPQLLLSNFTE
jgi:hypothetical protein